MVPLVKRRHALTGIAFDACSSAVKASHPDPMDMGRYNKAHDDRCAGNSPASSTALLGARRKRYIILLNKSRWFCRSELDAVTQVQRQIRSRFAGSAGDQYLRHNVRRKLATKAV